MTYGYISTATGSNDHHAEQFGILAFASNYRLGDIHFCHEAADQSPGNQPVLSGMIANLLPGDTLIAMGLGKLGSSTVEVLEVLSVLSRRGVKLYIVTSGIRCDDNVQAQVIATACSLVTQIAAEFETQRSAATTAQELPDDQSPTHTIRRTRKSRLDGMEEEIRSLLRDGATLAEIARAVEANRQTVADFINSRDLASPATTTSHK